MHEQTLISSQGARVLIEGRKEPLLNFSSNNYLGLAVKTRVNFISAIYTSLSVRRVLNS